MFGESFLEAGRIDDALAAFEKSNSAKADEAAHVYNLARVDAKRNQLDKAVAKLDTYLTRHFSSQGTGPYELFAELLGQLGEKEQIVDRLEKVRATDPDNLPLAYFLAERYRKNGQIDKAEPIYASLVEKHKSRPPLEACQGLIEIYRQQRDAAKLLGVLGTALSRAAR